ncbi:TetR/AcrR family transcriptional regulator [Microbacterium halotolerans]|uniref:TetR/AcrR family transcriptional regulator n=1 Tax=Microbacterium halotolerans TaxID=246613 RepID=UPI000E6AD380|nr:TetR/AcrR family transcriptional regulator [Microbacterium halotolerans]
MSFEAAGRADAAPGQGDENTGEYFARGPGRPRAEGYDERVLDAVVGLIDAGERVSVSAVVGASGVSRAAVYRRWSSIAELVADALDRGRAAIEFDLSGDVRDTIVAVLFGGSRTARGAGYSDRRFRTRLVLTLQNPELQRAYWQSHVRRRRVAMRDALNEAVRRGELRDDLDVDACIDLINGVFYYQFVVRGARWEEPETMARCREAFDVVWRGMSAR